MCIYLSICLYRHYPPHNHHPLPHLLSISYNRNGSVHHRHTVCADALPLIVEMYSIFNIWYNARSWLLWDIFLYYIVNLATPLTVLSAAPPSSVGKNDFCRDEPLSALVTVLHFPFLTTRGNNNSMERNGAVDGATPQKKKNPSVFHGLKNAERCLPFLPLMQ